MAQLPSIKLISREDLGPDAPDWTEKLLYPINLFMQSVYQALNKQLTDDNTKSQIKSFSIIGSATPEENVYSFTTDYATTPIEVALLKVERADNNPIIFAVAPYVSWTYRNGSLNVIGITGLSTGVRYTVYLKLSYK